MHTIASPNSPAKSLAHRPPSPASGKRLVETGVQLPLAIATVEFPHRVPWGYIPIDPTADRSRRDLLTIDNGGPTLSVRMAAIGIVGTLLPQDGITRLSQRHIEQRLGITKRTAKAAIAWLLSPMVSDLAAVELHHQPGPGRPQVLKRRLAWWEQVLRVPHGLPVRLYPAWLAFARWGRTIPGQQVITPNPGAKARLHQTNIWRLTQHWHGLTRRPFDAQVRQLLDGGWLMRNRSPRHGWVLLSQPPAELIPANGPNSHHEDCETNHMLSTGLSTGTAPTAAQTAIPTAAQTAITTIKDVLTLNRGPNSHPFSQFDGSTDYLPPPSGLADTPSAPSAPLPLPPPSVLTDTPSGPTDSTRSRSFTKGESDLAAPQCPGPNHAGLCSRLDFSHPSRVIERTPCNQCPGSTRYVHQIPRRRTDGRRHWLVGPCWCQPVQESDAKSPGSTRRTVTVHHRPTP